MNILFMGASGSGKGTQAKLLNEKYNLCHVSMGDLFREAKEKGTPNGLIAYDYVKNGNLVPLEITVKVLNDKIHSEKDVNGFIVDGFPRTVEQAEILDIPVDAVIYFKNDLNKLAARLMGRRTCAKCGGIFHTSTLTTTSCPTCGGELTIREDDNEASITKRFNFFKNETVPAVDYYREKGLVYEINADLSKEEVFEQIDNVIKKLI